MSKNPLVNALSASVYIILIATVMRFLTRLGNEPDTFFAPVVFLSLVTLSAAVMAYLFFYHPVQLLIEKKYKQAVTLFVHTVGIFGVFTVAALILLFAGVI